MIFCGLKIYSGNLARGAECRSDRNCTLGFGVQGLKQDAEPGPWVVHGSSFQNGAALFQSLPLHCSVSGLLSGNKRPPQHETVNPHTLESRM